MPPNALGRDPLTPERFPKIAREISLLYELSLAVGKDLELEPACDHFLKALMARKNLSFASVWLRSRAVPDATEATDGSGDGAELVWAIPQYRVDLTVISEEHPVFSELGDQRSLSVAESDPRFDELIFERGISGGSLAVFSLGDLGFLKLYSSHRKEPWDTWELNQLDNVINKFTVSLQACLDHARLKTEIAARRQAEEQTRGLARFPEENANPVLRVDADGTVLFANAASRDLLEVWKSGVGQRVPSRWASKIRECLTTATPQEHEEWCGDRALSLSLAPIEESGYVNIYGKDVTDQIRSAEGLRNTKALLELQGRIQNSFIGHAEPTQLFDELLSEIIVLTGSEYGFISEVTPGDGIPSTFSRLASGAPINGTPEGGSHDRDRSPRTGSTVADTVFQEVSTTGNPMIIDPSTYPRRDGDGSDDILRITSFLGLPILRGTEVVGVIGLANRPAGYDEEMIRFLDPLLTTCSSLIGAMRGDRLRQQTEEALRVSEERYRTLVEDANDIIFETDANGRFTYVNPAGLRITGYSADELLGTHFSSFIREDHRDTTIAHFGKQLEDQIAFTEHPFPITCSDGGEIWLEQKTRLVREGDSVRGFHSEARDITERVQTERALERARKRETEIGARIQQSLLIGQQPRRVDGLDVAALTIPSLWIDGDFYDFVVHSDSCIDLVVGDVMGKGVPAALVGAAVKSSVLRAVGSLVAQTPGVLPRPDAIVNHVHAAVAQQLIDVERFVTLCYVRFDTRDRSMILVDCGHTCTLRWNANHRKIETVKGKNLPLGILDDEVYEEHRFEVNEGDIFVFYSDGITEAADSAGELYSEERLASLVAAHEDLDSAALIDTIRTDVVSFTGTDSFADDLTCVAVAVTNPAARLCAPAELVIRSDQAELERLRAFVREFCATVPAIEDDEKWLGELLVAVQETTTNIIRHAHEGQSADSILATLEAQRNSIRVRLEHRGTDFTPGSAPAPRFDGSQERGFGLYLVSECVDHVQYLKLTDGWQAVHLTKYLPPTAEVE